MRLTSWAYMTGARLSRTDRRSRLERSREDREGVVWEDADEVQVGMWKTWGRPRGSGRAPLGDVSGERDSRGGWGGERLSHDGARHTYAAPNVLTLGGHRISFYAAPVLERLAGTGSSCTGNVTRTYAQFVLRGWSCALLRTTGTATGPYLRQRQPRPADESVSEERRTTNRQAQGRAARAKATPNLTSLAAAARTLIHQAPAADIHPSIGTYTRTWASRLGLALKAILVFDVYSLCSDLVGCIVLKDLAARTEDELPREKKGVCRWNLALGMRRCRGSRYLEFVDVRSRMYAPWNCSCAQLFSRLGSSGAYSSSGLPSSIMGDLEKGTPTEVENNTDESAAAKLWAVYISEAEKYDKALAGLFSASLTAFLIESYKTLSPDSGDTTVLLLSQISLQLTASANGSAFLMAPTTPFTPPTTSLICNALWFVSLGLSLSSALIATLLDQWARNFLHRSEMRSAPVVRARIFSYLYFGLKRFNMHAVVEVIPLLLHASLLLFLAGLVAFLLPVNRIIMGVAAGLLALLVLIYATLTILPILYLDCPFRTPLSGLLWRIFSALPQTLWQAANDHTSTVVEAMVNAATGVSEERTDRDHRALIWTVKSLADDSGLEPFVESIPDILWGPRGRRHLYDHHIATLVENPDTHLLARIERLLLSTDSGLLLPEAKTRRQITCLKALWAIAPATPLNFNLSLLSVPDGIRDPFIKHYAVSTRAHLRCGVFRLIDNRMDKIVAELDRCQAELLRGRLPSLTGPLESLVELERTSATYLSLAPLSCFDEKFNAKTQSPRDIAGFQLYLENAAASIQRYRVEASRMILLRYPHAAGSLSKPPFQFEHTQDAIQTLPHFSLLDPCSPFFLRFWQDVLNTTIHNLQAQSDVPEESTDRILGMLLSLWVPDTNGRIIIPENLVKFLNRSKSSQLTSFSHVSQNLSSSPFLPAITNILSGRYADSFKHDCLTALWYYFLGPRFSSRHRKVVSQKYDPTLAAVLSLPPSPASHSVTVLLKSSILMQFAPTAYWRDHESGISKKTILAHFDHPLFAPETFTELPAWFTEVADDAMISRSQCEPLAEILFQRTNEGRLMLLTEFLELCNTSDLPFEAAKTLEYIGVGLGIEPIGFHVNHQIRFASSVQNAFKHDHPDELLYEIIRLPIWSGKPIRWLDDTSSRQMIRDSFAGYVEKYPLDGPSYVRGRLQDILRVFAQVQTN
ncbi:hypothetical protein C8J57DRAFT_1712745 [Mycena rebaudengoi]|nr:hypothetical protein C8J57DRAFT_1712745 [Mycena rebaudengoi]